MLTDTTVGIGTLLKILNILIITVIALLSIAAGLAKLMQTEQEIVFLRGFGFNNAMIIAFGLVQMAGGVLLVPARTRLIGAVLAASAFVLSTILIFTGGDLVFGLVSTIPSVLSCVIVYQCERTHRARKLQR